MKRFLKQFKQILVTIVLMLIATRDIAQVKQPAKIAKPKTISIERAEFNRLLAQAGIAFTFPKGFKEIKAPNNEYFSFDYAMDLPQTDLEVWFQIIPQKENWASYERARTSGNTDLANPDSTYNSLAAAQATAFTGDNSYFVRVMPPEILARYNADAGKSYLLNLRDMATTKHYKYALLITLQKDHTGIILAVCFTNEKGPEFFKNVDRASSCMKFKTAG